MNKGRLLLGAVILALSGCMTGPAEESIAGHGEVPRSEQTPSVLDNFCTASMAVKGYC